VGKAFVAIRDQDISAEVMGVNVFKHKLLSFGVSSFYVGVAGSLLAYQARIISPENFPITVAIDQLGMVIIGGLGSILGSILGAAFIVLVPIFLTNAPHIVGISLPVALLKQIELMVFGGLILFFLIVEPHGLARLWQISKEKLRLWPFPH
jgi:branched-chain amino acid transport system permease protein